MRPPSTSATKRSKFATRRLNTTAVIVYFKGQRQGAARLLDAVVNGMMRRKEQA